MQLVYFASLLARLASPIGDVWKEEENRRKLKYNQTGQQSVNALTSLTHLNGMLQGEL